MLHRPERLRQQYRKGNIRDYKAMGKGHQLGPLVSGATIVRSSGPQWPARSDEQASAPGRGSGILPDPPQGALALDACEPLDIARQIDRSVHATRLVGGRKDRPILGELGAGVLL